MRYIKILAATALLGATFVTAAHAATEIVFNVFTGPRHFINDPFKAWAKDVTAATNGRVTVKFLPTSAAPPPKQMDGVVSGQFDAAFIFHGFTGKRAIGPQFGNLPFILDGNAEAGSVAYWRTYDKYFGGKNEFGKIGIKILSMFQFPGGPFYSGDDKPITSIADMKARKMWVLAGTPSRTLKIAGVNHVSGPAARVNEFTQTNVIDGIAGISMDAVRSFGALSFTKVATILDDKIQSASFAMFISAKKWNMISPKSHHGIVR
jgi:TRAP-type transport system periplasmic protein